MKFMTSAEATTSKVASAKGSACASATRKSLAVPPADGSRGRSARLRVDGEHRRGRARIDHQLGENASAAADFEPARARRRCHPIKEDGRDGTAPASHEALVGGAVVEAVRSSAIGYRRGVRHIGDIARRHSGLIPIALPASR